MHRSWLTLLLLAVFLTGCSGTPAEEEQDDGFDFADERDPWENVNRKAWSFNRDLLDPYLILPLANTYERVPAPARRGIYNMTENLTEPASMVNNLLQGKPREAGIAFSRFFLNSTLGLLGFFDIATQSGIEQEKESFGETLAVYGVPDGPYIMLPGAGPTVVIDRGGDVVDGFYFPAQILSFQASVIRLALRGLEQRIELKELEPMLESSLDEYAFVREAYFSVWEDKVYDGNPPEREWDDDWDGWGDDWEENGQDDDWDEDWEDEEWNSAQVPATKFDHHAWQRVKRNL